MAKVLTLKPATKSVSLEEADHLTPEQELEKVEKNIALHRQARNAHNQCLPSLIVGVLPAAGSKYDVIHKLDEDIALKIAKKRALQQKLRDEQVREAYREWGSKREASEKIKEALREAAKRLNANIDATEASRLEFEKIQTMFLSSRPASAPPIEAVRAGHITGLRMYQVSDGRIRAPSPGTMLTPLQLKEAGYADFEKAAEALIFNVMRCYDAPPHFQPTPPNAAA